MLLNETKVLIASPRLTNSDENVRVDPQGKTHCVHKIRKMNFK